MNVEPFDYLAFPEHTSAHDEPPARFLRRIGEAVTNAINRRLALHESEHHPVESVVSERQLLHMANVTVEEIRERIAEHERLYHGGDS